MGTRVDLIGWGGDGMGIVNALVGLVARHEDLWSAYRATSEVSRINSSHRPLVVGAAPDWGGGVLVSEETDRLLSEALVLARATGESFNPLVGPLVAAWDVAAMRAAYVAGAPLPPAPAPGLVEAALEASSPELLTRVGERRWLLRDPGAAERAALSTRPLQVPREGTRPLRAPREGTRPSPRLDLGGIAKGYTADACRDLAAELGASGVLVSVGSSSIAAYGTRADSSPWRVGMRDPNGGEASVGGVVELPADGMASLSTSGDNLGPLGAGRAQMPPGAPSRARDHHIIDPRTGEPARSGVRQVSVVASCGVLAEALSTALLVDPSVDVGDVVALWSRASGLPASARVVGLELAVP
ncbi:FAD:protein FMN transferase [Cellulomonas flavigena]|uniref:FAD:protein FMN transferase n=1 Tax=Cellulomonas flavigena TaxID=1711 RepID=UPI0006608F37|nr:FAD:protein FMN transferase [Cellulomonas flavigena]